MSKIVSFYVVAIALVTACMTRFDIQPADRESDHPSLPHTDMMTDGLERGTADAVEVPPWNDSSSMDDHEIPPDSADSPTLDTTPLGSDSGAARDTAKDNGVDSEADSETRGAGEPDADQTTDTGSGGRIDGDSAVHPDAEADTEVAVDTGADADGDTGGDVDSSTGTGWDASGDNDQIPVYPEITAEGGAGNITNLESTADPSPSRGGACNYGETAILSYGSINVNVLPGDAAGQWDRGRICGQCAEVGVLTAAGEKRAVVRIMDRCADEFCGISIGGHPAQRLMGDLPGRYNGWWRFVPCPDDEHLSDGPPTLFVKEGSSRYWALIQIRNPRARVASIRWETEGGAAGELAWAEDPENFLVLPSELRNAAGRVTLSVQYDFGFSDTLVTTSAALVEPNAAIPLH